MTVYLLLLSLPVKPGQTFPRNPPRPSLACPTPSTLRVFLESHSLRNLGALKPCLRLCLAGSPREKGGQDGPRLNITKYNHVNCTCGGSALRVALRILSVERENNLSIAESLGKIGLKAKPGNTLVE